MLIQDHSLLRIFGIEPDEVIKDGITLSELIFINTSLDASGAMEKVRGEHPVTLTEYRKNFLKNRKVRTVWKKYLRTKTFSPSQFTKAVDAYIAEFESKYEKSS